MLLITAEAVEELAALGYPVYWGALGENLTTRGLDRQDLRIGQRLRVGSVLIDLTEARPPCYTIAVYGEGILAAMGEEGMSGFYASVVEAGIVRPGDPIVRV